MTLIYAALLKPFPLTQLLSKSSLEEHRRPIQASLLVSLSTSLQSSLFPLCQTLPHKILTARGLILLQVPCYCSPSRAESPHPYDGIQLDCRGQESVVDSRVSHVFWNGFEQLLCFFQASDFCNQKKLSLDIYGRETVHFLLAHPLRYLPPKTKQQTVNHQCKASQ